MAFEMQNKDTIQARMVTELAKISDKTGIEGAFGRDLINANSVEFENSYAEMNLMIDAAFADSSWGSYLTARCSEYGVDRKTATTAVGTVTFSGGQGALIPAGSIVTLADNSIQYTTDNTIILDATGKGSVSITAKTAGKVGNVAAGTINKIPLSIAGITKVVNAEATRGGYDAETDGELLARYKTVVKTPATSGNKYHYYNWAMSISGVGACKVLPLWQGAGTVKVVIVDNDMLSASEETIKKVADYIETVRPIGATVTVTSPAPLAIDIVVDVVGTVDKDKFIQAVNKYIGQGGLDIAYISAGQISKILTQQDIKDYRNLTLNGKDRVDIGTDILARVGTVTVNEFANF